MLNNWFNINDFLAGIYARLMGLRISWNLFYNKLIWILIFDLCTYEILNKFQYIRNNITLIFNTFYNNDINLKSKIYCYFDICNQLFITQNKSYYRISK